MNKLIYSSFNYFNKKLVTLPSFRFSCFNQSILYNFSKFPKHEVLTMPALSPTMTEGKILRWLKKEGDQVQPGDVICEVETDKATMGFEVQQKGYLAKILNSADLIPLGTPVAVVIKKNDQIKEFEGYKFSAQGQQKLFEVLPEPPVILRPHQPDKYPAHSYLKMPAVSPTMTEGKILKWKVKPGDPFTVGDALFSIETDKAVIDYEATEKGILAKILADENTSLEVGKSVAVVVKKADNVSAFVDYTEGAENQPVNIKVQSSNQKSPLQKVAEPVKEAIKSSVGGKVIASPLAKTIAKQKGLDLSLVKGSGPNGRIIKQDVQSFKVITKNVETPQVQIVSKQNKVIAEEKPVKQFEKKPKFNVPENPFEQIPLTSMRKTIAARLTDSNMNVPHYYVSASIEMNALNTLRNALNAEQKSNGVKISINDMIVKATALALRDIPAANVQWHDTSIKRFKHADISVAVAIESGLITPIVFRAETLGLIDIAKRTKDVAKRAKQGKLDPMEYIGGTSTVSNLGMYGIDTVTSIINRPQATILGVGKTDKKILFDAKSTNPDKPYRVADVMEIIVSADHRVVDGAVAGEWLMRIKKYLENPTFMLL